MTTFIPSGKLRVPKTVEVEAGYRLLAGDRAL
jgi:hypothetical protein